jgi:predicted nucleotidyltransferase component of viral defense system
MIKEQSLKDRLKTLAGERNIPFNTCWKQLLLERFLVRLSTSDHKNKLIFKGGFLLSYLMKIGRETMDLDFLLTRMTAEKNELQEMLEQILSGEWTDGFRITFDSIELLNQPHMDYPGYRVILNTSFAKMKDKIQIDIGVGDNVHPLTREIFLFHYHDQPIFESSVSLLVYPIETIFSEKLETILSKGPSNSRMKDYHDLLFLIHSNIQIHPAKLKKALTITFSHRGTKLRHIQFDEDSLKEIQKLWSSHLQGLGKFPQNNLLPKDISSGIQEINNYVSLFI